MSVIQCDCPTRDDCMFAQCPDASPSNRRTTFAVQTISSLTALIALCFATAAAQQPPKLTLAQVEGLVAHGVPDSTLSTQIQRRGIDFTPTTAIVESLRSKDAGPLTLAAMGAFLSTSPSGSASPGADTQPDVSRTSGSAPINAVNAGALNLRVVAHVRGNAYEIDSAGDGRMAGVQVVGIDSGISLIDLRTGTTVGRCPAYSPYAISMTGRTIAGVTGHELQLCDPFSASGVNIPQTSTAEIRSLTFSQDSRILAVGYSDGVVSVWDVVTKRLLWTSPPYRLPVSRIALSPDGKRIAVAYGPSCVRYWHVGSDVFREKQLPDIASAGHDRSLSFVANGRRIILGMETTTLAWDQESGSARIFPQGADAISPDERFAVKLGDYLGAGAQGYTPLTLWDLSTGNVISTVKTAPGMLATSVTFARDGTALLATTNGGNVLMWQP